MLGLDDAIAQLSAGGSLLVVVLVAALLGLRHATDPDHIAAVTTLVASGEARAGRAAARLGAFWGLGHAITLLLFGLPMLLSRRVLPEPVLLLAETAVAAVIVLLALRLYVRWRHGLMSLHPHVDGDPGHVHAVRAPAGAYGIGLVHGVGGSAGVGVLLLAAIPSEPLACTALVVLALCTAVSMTALTGGLGVTLTAAPAARVLGVAAPALAVAGVAFGTWYALGAWGLTAYPL